MDARAWDDRYASTPLVWSAGPNRFVEETVTGMAPGRALDVACGEGRNALWLASLGWRATAVDFSAVAVDKGRALAAERDLDVAWVVADVTTWTPDPAGFDLVLVCYLQLPAEARAAAYRRAAAAVGPGGTLLVVAHDVDNVDHGHGGPQDPAVCTTPEGVVAVIGDLTVVEAGRVHRTVTTDAGPVEAIDTLVRATRA